MPRIIPKRKAPKQEQLTEALQGELATYEKVGLFQRSVKKGTVYRYRGCLLQYQRALDSAIPTLDTSVQFLAHLRQEGFSPSSLRLYRAALQGFHAWRGEQLNFPVRVPHHLPEYIEPTIITKILKLSRNNPKDHLILRLMAELDMMGIKNHWNVFLFPTVTYSIYQPYLKGYSGESLGYGQWRWWARHWIDQDLKKSMGR